jgi:hypothetical protein
MTVDEARDQPPAADVHDAGNGWRKLRSVCRQRQDSPAADQQMPDADIGRGEDTRVGQQLQQGVCPGQKRAAILH